MYTHYRPGYIHFDRREFSSSSFANFENPTAAVDDINNIQPPRTPKKKKKATPSPWERKQ